MKKDNQIKEQRTFGIISHPDAGKTTRTEKRLLLWGRANSRRRKNNKIGDKADVEAIERHGEPVDVIAVQSQQDALDLMKARIKAFMKMEYNSLGIICTTQEQVDALHAQWKKDFRPKLLDARGVAFGSGVVTTAHFAKGLGFDQVLVPQVNDGNYNTSADRQMRYVACTRAMHSLVLSFAGKPSRFIA